MKSDPISIGHLGLRVGDSPHPIVQARLHVLGRFSLELEGGKAGSLATQKARALLAYVVAHRDSDVARERLMDFFWRDASPESARDGLRSTLWMIRRRIRDSGCRPDDYLVANRAVVRWKARTWFDAEAFEHLAKSDDPADLDACLDLYGGDFLEGDYEEWILNERTRLCGKYESVLSRLVRTYGRSDAAQLLLSRNAYDEPSYALLIQQELDTGRIVAASALAAQAERALSEIGAEASPPLAEVIAGIATRRIERAPAFVLPFSGRNRELYALSSALDGTGARVAIVVGEAGIGKSALLAHAVELARNAGIQAAAIHCVAGDPRPYGPFEEVYERFYRVPFALKAATDAAEPAYLLAHEILAHLNDSNILSIDDAHALPPDGLRVLAFLVKNAPAEKRTLFIATRTEGLRNVQTAIASNDHQTLFLGPLALDDLRSGITSSVNGDSEELIAAIFERSAGHPLFAVSILESLAQSGLLRSEAGSWTVTGTVRSRMPLPKSLTAYIRSRLHDAGENAAAVAAALAIEPSAMIGDLANVLNLQDEDILRAVDDLLQLDILSETQSGFEIGFSHDLYREVAATALNAARRTRLHSAFAQRLALRGTRESTIQCARHLVFAGDALAAADVYHRAALQAFETGSTAEAAQRCKAGIGVLDGLQRNPEVECCRARLKITLARAHLALCEVDAALSHLEDAIAAAKKLNDPAMRLEASLERETVFVSNVDPVSVAAGSDEIIAMATAHVLPDRLCVTLCHRSWAYRLLGDEAEAVRSASDAENAAVRAGDHELSCLAITQSLLCAVTWWRFEEGALAAKRGQPLLLHASETSRAALQCARASLYMASERPREANIELERARCSLSGSAASAARIVLEAAAARLACTQGDPGKAMGAALLLEAIDTPRARALASLFRAEAAFQCSSLDADAGAIMQNADAPFFQDVDSGSRSPQLAAALLAALLGRSAAGEMVVRALDAVEDAARRAPLDSDKAFAQLASAAGLCGAKHAAMRATLRSHDYRAVRVGAVSRQFTGSRNSPNNS